jgi:tetratricopeptide (TPR) repeat protein
MIADSETTVFNWAGFAYLTAACLIFAPAARAQSQPDIDRCAGKDVPPDLQISSCTAVIQSNNFAGKDLAFAFNNRGRAHHAKREFDRAIQDYSEAIKLDADFAQGYSNRALAQQSLGDFDRAITDYGQAIRLDPATVATFSGRGNAYLALKDYDRAIADYTKAVAYTEAIRLAPATHRPFTTARSSMRRTGTMAAPLRTTLPSSGSIR